MKYLELLENGYYDPVMDRANTSNINDTRKPKLTLFHLNKLRKMREAKKLDLKDRKEFFKKIYNQTAAGDDQGPSL